MAKSKKLSKGIDAIFEDQPKKTKASETKNTKDTRTTVVIELDLAG